MDRVSGPTAFEVTGPRTRITFEVPPRRVTEVRVRKVGDGGRTQSRQDAKTANGGIR
jgi:hypothetical protein